MPTNRLIIKEEVTTYATVLLDALNEAGGQDAVLDGREQLEALTSYLRTSIELSGALADPSYTPEQHHAIMRNTMLEVGMNPIIVDVLSVMAERGDISLLSQVQSCFKELLEAKLGITVVDVTTAVPLDDNLRKLISEKTAKDLGTNVVLREHIDKSILGGIVMSTHGKRIDASVQSQLETARNVLKLSTDGGES